MKQRIVTGAVAAVFFLLFLQMGGWAFSLLMIAMALVGYHEFLRIHRIPATDAVALIGFAAAAFLASPLVHLPSCSRALGTFFPRDRSAGPVSAAYTADRPPKHPV